MFWKRVPLGCARTGSRTLWQNCGGRCGRGGILESWWTLVGCLIFAQLLGASDQAGVFEGVNELPLEGAAEPARRTCVWCICCLAEQMRGRIGKRCSCAVIALASKKEAPPVMFFGQGQQVRISWNRLKIPTAIKSKSHCLGSREAWLFFYQCGSQGIAVNHLRGTGQDRSFAALAASRLARRCSHVHIVIMPRWFWQESSKNFSTPNCQ